MDNRQYAPATQRNKEPILKVLQSVITDASNILEIASGTGEHAVFFARGLPLCYWIPSDVNPMARESIVAWKDYANVDNLALPLTIDAMEDGWSDRLLEPNINAIVNINMIHISPWAACLGLINGAGKLLSEGGLLYLYGPYKRNGEHTAISNANFDRNLRDRNWDWGIRDLEAVVEVAAAANLQLQQAIEMPANNLSVIFSKG